MKMKITETDRIDLDGITNNLKYAQVAMLVDKDEFIIKIKKIRKSLGLSKLLDYDKVDEWLCKTGKESSLSKMDKKDKEIFNQRFYLGNSIANIKEGFHKNIYFTDVIKYSILAGKVTDKEYTWTTFCEEFPFSDEFKDAEFEAEWPMVAIFVNPETKLDEINVLLKTQVNEIFKKIYGDKHDLKKSENIRRDREWYWLNHSSNDNRMGYIKIAEKNNISSSGVREAIKQYKQNLSMNF